jgi:hypothetical protein
MPFTVIGWSVSQAAASALAAISALADPHVRVVGNDIYVPKTFSKFAGAYGLGASVTQAQFTSPSLRRTLLFDLEPLEVSATPLCPARWENQFDAPIPLDETEALDYLAANNAGAAVRQVGLAFLADGPAKLDTRPSFTVRCTSATATVAYTWTNVGLTITQTLPKGMYDIVGMWAQSTGLIAARLVFPGPVYQRPGCIGCTALGNFSDPAFRNGGLGVWGSFAHDAPPTVDMLSSSADATQIVLLDVVKTG